MVGFSLGEILNRPVDTEQQRVDRMQEAFDAAVIAFCDLRFDDARDLIAQIKGEVDSTEIFLEVHGISPDWKPEDP